MGKILEQHVACPCGKSSDGYCVYNDGDWCFVCQEGTSKMVDPNNITQQIFGRKGISVNTHKFFNVTTSVTDDGVPLSVYYPYSKGFKIRNLNPKDFYTEGDMKGPQLWGKHKFSGGSSKAITVTEGEDDCMAVFQMLGSKHPCVSVKSGPSARRDCESQRDYLNSFERIYLCFDSDSVGQEAVKEVAKLFDINKIYHVKMDKFKDAGEYLENNCVKEFVSVWWNSRKFLPKGIINGIESIEEILNREDNKPIATYPWSMLNDMTYGIRSGELNLFTAQEKIGKTEVMRAIEYHLLKTTDENLGIIHLEELEKRSVQGLVSYELGVPCHLPDVNISVDEELQAYLKLTKGTPERLYFYSHFGSDDPDTILDIVRYLASVCNCKFVFLDHITMVVTGHKDDGDERRKLDYISTKLAEMTRELDFTLFLVSHVNEEGKTRGSKNISKVADLIVSLDRDLENPSYVERNKTRLMVKGNRFGGVSGPSSTLWFDQETWKVQELNEQVLAEQQLKEGF